MRLMLYYAIVFGVLDLFEILWIYSLLKFEIVCVWRLLFAWNWYLDEGVWMKVVLLDENGVIEWIWAGFTGYIACL